MQNTMNICHLLTLTRWGGTENRLYDFIRHSQHSGLVHHIIATSGADKVVEAFKETGTSVYIPPRSFHYDPRALWHMARQLRKWHIDVVHTRGWVGNCWGGLAARFARIPHIISAERGDIFLEQGRFRTSIESRLHHSNDFVIANSVAAKTMLTLTRGLPEEHVRVLYSGIDLSTSTSEHELRTEFGLAPQTPVVGTVGRLYSQKDHFTFVRAAKIVHKQQPEVVFVIVGGGELEHELRQQIARHKLEKTILLAGWRKDVPAFLAMFDLFVFTSIWESLPGAVIEAGLAGKAIIAPAVCGIPELVIDNETGILLVPTEIPRIPDIPGAIPLPENTLISGILSPCRSLDPELLAERILYLLNHPHERSRLGENAQAYVKEKFALETYVRNMEEIYLELAKKPI